MRQRVYKGDSRTSGLANRRHSSQNVEMSKRAITLVDVWLVDFKQLGIDRTLERLCKKDRDHGFELLLN